MQKWLHGEGKEVDVGRLNRPKKKKKKKKTKTKKQTNKQKQKQKNKQKNTFHYYKVYKTTCNRLVLWCAVGIVN